MMYTVDWNPGDVFLKAQQIWSVLHRTPAQSTAVIMLPLFDQLNVEEAVAYLCSVQVLTLNTLRAKSFSREHKHIDVTGTGT